MKGNIGVNFASNKQYLDFILSKGCIYIGEGETHNQSYVIGPIRDVYINSSKRKVKSQ